MKRILLAVTGGIAAYKAIDLTSKLTQAGYDVSVMLTDHAQEFVTPLAFQAIGRNPVYTSTFIEQNPKEIQHVALGDWADAIVVAPATANTIAKLAHGIADDMVTSTLLATETPKFVAPAMNVHMYENNRTQQNMATLRSDGYYFLEPGEGYLACGYVAKGRMEEPLQIVERLNLFFKDMQQNQTTKESRFEGVHALVTAGPTIEELDPVRYLSNRSSGKMGYALAESLEKRGAIVTLVSGPTNIVPPENVDTIQVTSAEEMFKVVKNRFETQDIIFKAAAVSDYAPVETLDHKLKKQDGTLSVTFKRTPDILKYLGEHKTSQFLVGFAAETQNIETYAQQKLKHKNADVIIANNVGDRTIGFSSDDNDYTMYFENGDETHLGKAKKVILAERILDSLENRWQ
ncbi:bifunctional phosphopantothenoylcysteine decarboxylase/phosphopantothenate--cysteine ligase CoaBC [Staphylococcus succinus]|jgi:phosphopantothenoylcysteine decarboxylase/phosphopantothenate--cysteine ligase|uniref:Coenzyme A biosynthesis bifunctional protein CoaBC n=1 Tax=Staphylococcus succinus TaxID=61015 RepID=A0A9Q6HNQ6_9STAP|nr:bifunctional phosphopantothenoylcysteine decarboxylase/phosphopantothenate--cysteine ligase CoaBC [Staphylococcus succinus]MEB8126303.1 bifunctional phosphopantothenoylcysteine decarboxylase/phosphopantothenate--cysteine ligase CoaBC [Staphylococcus succinus]MEB8209654.1 bifunctional phosphopantothenoylcysteine decarboxylase/phosphopantothenate--cysteine ligase CoaBC [Staphylococcus succinus]PTI75422.1 bifunctional phosphopantothenoylcysteine decarboxylase/phosphopantothenate--cysteine ligase